VAAETLASYLAATRRLLHDAQKQYWSDADVTLDINQAIAHRDLWSGGSRSYQQNVPLTTGVDQYNLATLFPTLTVLDVITVWLIYGSTRIELTEVPFSMLTNRFRPFTTFQNRPGGYCRYGATGLFIATAPGGQYSADFDLSVLSTTLVNANDQDPLPFPYTTPVPYYAAYLAFLNQRQFDKADTMLGFFQKAVMDIEGARVGEMMLQTQGGARVAR
jgi:hypothetical protein